jgi:hypothetical protein
MATVHQRYAVRSGKVCRTMCRTLRAERTGPLRPIADDRRAIGCMGATEFAPKIRKRYQTNQLVVDSTEFGTRGSEVQILSPRPIFL